MRKGLINKEIAILSDEIKNRADAETGSYCGPFKAYNAGGFYIREFANLFEAIDECAVHKFGGYLVNGKEERVFEFSGEDDFYLYIKDCYMGKTKNNREADLFCQSYDQAHALKGDGRFYNHKWVKLSGMDPQRYEGKEPFSGSFIYKYANPKRKIIRLTQLVRTSQMQFIPSKNPHVPFNAYIFVCSMGGWYSCDIGLISGNTYNGEWKIYMRALGEPLRTADVVLKPSGKDVFGAYTYSDDLFFDFTSSVGTIKLEITNLTTGRKTVMSTDNYIDTKAKALIELQSPKDFKDNKSRHTFVENGKTLKRKIVPYNRRTFLSAVSFVPVFDTNNRINYNQYSGGYLKNIVFEEIKLYSEKGGTYDFYADSDINYCAYIYNVEGISVKLDKDKRNRKTVRETVDICYARDFRLKVLKIDEKEKTLEVR